MMSKAKTEIIRGRRNQRIHLCQPIMSTSSPPSISASTLIPLFGLSPSDPALTAFLQTLSPSVPKPEIAQYPDEAFYTYPTLGLVLSFVPSSSKQLKLDRIDFFAPSPPAPPSARSRRKAQPTFAPPPIVTFTFPSTTLTLPPKDGKPGPTIDRPPELMVKPGTTGREFVSCFGGPSKRGRQAGFVPTYLEWGRVDLKATEGGESGVGVMVELREKMEDGMNVTPSDVWTKAAEWEWSCLKVFKAS